MLVIGRGIVPRPGAVWRVFGATLAVAAAAGTANLLTGGNYMWLREKPDEGSLLDFMGPWPWYIVSAAVLGLLLFTLLARRSGAARRQLEYGQALEQVDVGARAAGEPAGQVAVEPGDGRRALVADLDAPGGDRDADGAVRGRRRTSARIAPSRPATVASSSTASATGTPAERVVAATSRAIAATERGGPAGLR